MSKFDVWKMRAVRSVAAMTVAGGVVMSGTAQGETIEAYDAGTGSRTSSLVVDFDFIGGPAYKFDYHHDGSASGADMLLDLDDAGSLDVQRSFNDFGSGPQIFVEGFSYDGNTANPGFQGERGENWSYWTSEDLPEAPADWTVAGTFGPSSRALADGSYDGFALNVSEFADGDFTPTNDPPAAVPSPESAAQWSVLMMLVSLWLIRRRPSVGL